MFESRTALKAHAATLGAELERSTEAVKKATEKIEDQVGVIANLNRDIQKLTTLVDDLRGRNKDLAKTVREQCEADILLNALQAVGIIKAPKPLPDYKAYHDQRMNQLAGMRQNPVYNQLGTRGQAAANPFGGLF